MSLKFKNRIAIFNTVTAAIVSALVFIAVYTVVHITSVRHLDHDILTEKKEVYGNLVWIGDSIIINKMPEWEESEHRHVEVNPTFLQISDFKGRIVFLSANMLDGSFPVNQDNRISQYTDAEIGGKRIRMGQFAIQNGVGHTIGQLTIAVSQEESHRVLTNLVWVLIISFPVVLIVLFIASSVAASTAIAPVNKLIETASVIGAANIANRLELPAHRDELYQLATTINELLTRIEGSIVRQKQFTSDASHEIRTPLAAIRGTLEVLVRRPREQKEYEKSIHSIIAMVDRLEMLLEHLLQLARSESGLLSVNKSTINLYGFLCNLTTKWEQAASAASIQLICTVPDTVQVSADKIYLELMIDNLISNAIKYGRENGKITVDWLESESALLIADDGIGISQEKLPHIFDRFYRADESRSSSGHGLGLSIARNLAELQQFTLNVRSTEGSGTTFILRFRTE